MQAKSAVLFALVLVECAPLIGLDEDYYVADRGGGGQTGAAGQAGGSATSGGGSAGFDTGGRAGEGGDAGDAGGGVGGTAGAANAGADGGSAGAAGAGSVLPAIPRGKLVYHRYTEYAAGDSEMFVVSFPELTVTADLATIYGICNPLNGIFSPDGSTLAVAAQPPGCSSTVAADQDVYLLDLENPPSKVKVTQNALPDEDPQYSPDGAFLLFKHNKHLAKWDVGGAPFTDCQSLPAGSACFASSTAEQSKPVVHPDGTQVFYYELYGANADIFRFDLEQGLAAADINTIRMPVVFHDDLSDARPNVSATHLYYVRWSGPTMPLDKIARRPLSNLLGSLDGYPLFATDVGSDYSDPFSIAGDLVVFSSDITGYGKHDLFIADWNSTEIFSLNDWIADINSEKDDLGGVFWAAPEP